jgi:prepilin-type processing-associated H-X9-DG protein
MIDQAQAEDVPTPTRRTLLNGVSPLRIAVGVFVGLLLLFALAYMSICPAPEAARRAKCCDSLRDIRIAMNGYQAKYGTYPPPYTVDKQGRRMHSWRALLLEFLDRDLYAKYDFNHPWNSPHNLTVADMMTRNGPYHCPSEAPEKSLWTSYVMIVGPTAFGNGSTGRKPDEITDGLTNTLAIVEMSPSGILWTAPYDLNVAEMSYRINDPDQPGLRSRHSEGVVVVFADGHIQYIANGLDPDLLKALTTINGGEEIDHFAL